MSSDNKNDTPLPRTENESQPQNVTPEHGHLCENITSRPQEREYGLNESPNAGPFHNTFNSVPVSHFQDVHFHSAQFHNVQFYGTQLYNDALTTDFQPCCPMSFFNEEADARGTDTEESNQEEDEKDEELIQWTELLTDEEDLGPVICRSTSQSEWARQKRDENQKNIYLDRIMSMIGIENVKSHFLWVKNRVDVASRWNKNPSDLTFDLVLRGNDGTGKLQPSIIKSF